MIITYDIYCIITNIFGFVNIYFANCCPFCAKNRYFNEKNGKSGEIAAMHLRPEYGKTLKQRHRILQQLRRAGPCGGFLPLRGVPADPGVRRRRPPRALPPLRKQACRASAALAARLIGFAAFLISAPQMPYTALFPAANIVRRKTAARLTQM